MSKLRKDVEALTLGKKKAKDYDPEDEHVGGDHEDDESSNTEDATDGREHYQAVGQSKLRKPEAAPLASKYGGVAVSRAALDADESEDDPFAPQADEEENDPFTAPGGDKDEVSDRSADLDQDVDEIDEDESIDSDEAFGESDDGRFKKFTFRGSKKNRMSKDEKGGYREEQASDALSESEEDDLSDEDMDDADGTEDELEDDEDDEDDEDEEEEEAGEDEDEETDASEEEQDQPSVSRKREDLKAYLSTEANTLASTLSQAASADAKKGIAVKRQYQTFDRLLDARIKLQKGFTASDELTQSKSTFGSEAEDALTKAQDAAVQLYNTIDSFRHTLSTADYSNQHSKKRKRSSLAANLDGLKSIWTTLQELENEALPVRRTTIDKWSNKIKASDPTRAAAAGKSKFLVSTANDKLTSVLDTYIINEQDKYFRTQTNRTEDDRSDGEDGQPDNNSPPKYDDTLFYQSLLRDLIITRSATSSTANNTSLPIVPHKLHESGNRQNKTVRDTKASKGRKIRYTVHEKLQNFMAAEGDTGRDTAMWTERGKVEFFGSLFGGDRALVEDEDEDEEMRDGEDADGAEVEALRLFRT